MSEFVIETQELTKIYGEQICVDSVSLHVRKGTIYGLLGRNGAGKTTVMKMILGLTEPTKGEIRVFDTSLEEHMEEILPRIGALIETPGFYPNLTATENLKIMARVRKIDKKKIKEVLDLVGLPYNDKKLYKAFSMGMKQRLGIANALIHNPEILILDEPINGLDPDGIIEIRRLIQELNKEHEITVIISSHILSEMELLADTVGIMKDGNMIQEISMKDIHEQNAAYIEIETDNAEKAGYILDEILQIKQFRVISDGIIQVFDLSKSGKEISSALMKYGIGVESIQKKQNSLEEFFFKTTRRSLD